MERVAGIEPACAAWKAAVLPLNYTRTPVHAITLLTGHKLDLASAHSNLKVPSRKPAKTLSLYN